jgi:hypothetical protein
MGLCSSRAVRTRLAASYAAGAAGLLTSELQGEIWDPAKCHDYPTKRLEITATTGRLVPISGIISARIDVP